MKANRKFAALAVTGIVLPALLFYSVSLPRSPGDRGLKLMHKDLPQFSVPNHTVIHVDQIPPTTPSPHTALAEHVQRMCHKLDMTPVPSKVRPDMFHHILVDDRYKFLYCYIPKVACTNWRRVMLVLSGKVKVKDLMDIQATDVHARYRRFLPTLSDMSMEQIRYRLDNYYKFMFVREPFERLLSAYRNKLQSKHKSSQYFRDTFGRSIIKRFRESQEGDNKGGKPVNAKNANKQTVHFHEFLQYLVDPVRTEPLNEHWAKYYKLCHPCFMNYDFIGKYDTLEADASHVLKAVHADHVDCPDHSQQDCPDHSQQDCPDHSQQDCPDHS
nr:hypothetical protein BaRGS_026169 [Batillaria attramentaria]